MALYGFGPGSLYLTRTDISNATPLNIGYAQEFSIDIDPDTKTLFGQNQFPVAVARSTVKATAKATAAQISGNVLNAAVLGGTLTTGSKLLASSEAAAVPSSTPWQVTVANAANFDKDCGVINATTGLPLQLVASGPTTGQYSVTNAGVYTFASADANTAVAISYLYKSTTAGQTLAYTNQLIGASPFFQLDYATTYNNLPFTVRIYQALVDKYGLDFKLADFATPKFEFMLMANAAGKVFDFTFGEKS